MKFGDYLIKRAHMPLIQIQEALSIQAMCGKKKLGRILVELGHLTQDELNGALQSYMDTDLPNSAVKTKEHMRNICPCRDVLELAAKYKILQIGESKENIELAALRFDDHLIERLENKVKKSVIVRVVSREIFDFLSHTSNTDTKRKKIVLTHDLSDEEKLQADSPYVLIFRELLKSAKAQGVSDIHIEPGRACVRVRFRLHGALSDVKVLGVEHRKAFITTVKGIINLNLAIIGRPQDSRASFGSLKLDIRANSLPTLFGEKIVLRLLDQESSFHLSEAGLSKAAQAELKTAVNKRDGLILISGPTGSGKTTTLYSLLREVDSGTKNVSTLENPVEHELPSINQVNIRDQGQLSFANALRALMRQDPDVILIGEIRDEETAKLAFKAAATGHLGLSTVHANNSMAVIERLLGLGVDALTIRENLRLSCAQRLVPLLCQGCSTLASKQHISECFAQLKIKMGPCPPGDFRQRNERGCDQCHKGIRGRRAILELMTKEHIQKFLLGGDGPFVYQSLQDEALDLAKSGEIDLLEVTEIA